LAILLPDITDSRMNQLIVFALTIAVFIAIIVFNLIFLVWYVKKFHVEK